MSKHLKNNLHHSPFLYEIMGDKNKHMEFRAIPILVRNYNAIQSSIENAKRAGKREWYEASQETIWSGPYRHHFLKRKKYVENILQCYASSYKVNALLDLGCGDGANFAWLKPYTKNLYGSDYNISRLIRANKRNIAKEVVLADVTDYAARDNAFDIIFFNHVLEHIPEDEKALHEVFRILKKSGICILGVPNEGVFWWQLAYKLQPKSLQNSDHVQFYTVKTLSKKIKEAGFIIKEVKRLGWGLPHWDLDSMVRQYKILDDLFEFFGRILIPNQASSLYFIIQKQ